MNTMNMFALIGGIVSAAFICIAIIWDASARLTAKCKKKRNVGEKWQSAEKEAAVVAALTKPMVPCHGGCQAAHPACAARLP